MCNYCTLTNKKINLENQKKMKVKIKKKYMEKKKIKEKIIPPQGKKQTNKQTNKQTKQSINLYSYFNNFTFSKKCKVKYVVRLTLTVHPLQHVLYIIYQQPA